MAQLLAERAESERLRQIIKELQRHRFGRRAESPPEDQLLLGLEEVEQIEAAGQADSEEKKAGLFRVLVVRRPKYACRRCEPLWLHGFFQ